MSQRQPGFAKHVIVVSYDAFSEDNWETASKLPHMAALLDNGSYTTKLESVYPTLTYVIHASYVTGVYPDKHGVYHNNPLQPFVPENDQRWHWYRSDVQAPTIYDAVRDQGMTSAGLLWPVTGKASITYNIPEMKAIGNENQAVKILKNGSPLFSLGMEWKYGRYRQGVRQPQLDQFTTLCAADTIVRKKPHLLLVHLIELDDAKHAGGTQGAHIEQALKRMDDRIGQLVHAAEKAGIRKDTVFIIVGDHGQKDVRRTIHLNRLLHQKGLIYEADGVMHWRAYVQGAGGSACLHIREGDDEAERLAVDAIREAMASGDIGVEQLYTRAELDRLRVERSIRYMLEAKLGYCFADDYDKPIVASLDKKAFATHGYSPEKENYTSVLLLSGAGVKSGHRFDGASVVDLAPTLARLLGVPFGPCDGRALDEVLEAP